MSITFLKDFSAKRKQQGSAAATKPQIKTCLCSWNFFWKELLPYLGQVKTFSWFLKCKILISMWLTGDWRAAAEPWKALTFGLSYKNWKDFFMNIIDLKSA